MKVILLVTCALAAALPVSAGAQQTPAQQSASTPATEDDTIVVTAPRQSGAVVSDVPPVLELDEQAVESYGAGSLTDLIAAIAPQTGPGRGRGGGGPVILLNGQRISSFAEIRDLPPEAIKRVQILPEQVALQYGYSADQRVVNFILKDDFRALTVDAEYGGSTAGSLRQSELGGVLTRIGKMGRLTLGAERETASRVLESDRGILQSPTTFPFDPGRYRTLSPETETTKLNGVLNRKLTDIVSATINASWQRDTSDALLGVRSTGALTDPALARNTTVDALHGGLTLNGNLSKFNWTLTGNYDRSISKTDTDRDIIPSTRDTARSQTDTSEGIYTLSGPIATLPAGVVRATLRGGFQTTRLTSDATRLGVRQASHLSRDEANGRINVDVPLASASRDVAGALGDLSINANIAYRKLSDFGGLTSFGYGLNWQPTPGLTLLASAIGADKEPGIGDLGNANLVTSGVPTYDFTRGETLLVTRITGGNPALLTERQRDVKLSTSYQPPSLKGLSVGVDFFRNRSANPVASFPILTPDIEAAFPGRVTRDASGRLISIDSRAVNFAATRSNVLRVGFTFQREFAPSTQNPFGMGGGGRRGPGAGGPPPGAGGGAPGGGRGGGFGRGMMGGGDGGRWQVGLYDNIRFMDQIVIRPGLPVLDLLGGDATGSSGGSPRHSIDLDAGWFNKGIGFRLTGSYQSGSVVTGSDVASTLRFGDLATLNINAFINFDNRKKLVEDVPFLKGARLRIGVTNLFDSIRDVRDGTGLVPLSYQPGYLDPKGRYIEVDFRKRF